MIFGRNGPVISIPNIQFKNFVITRSTSLFLLEDLDSLLLFGSLHLCSLWFHCLFWKEGLENYFLCEGEVITISYALHILFGKSFTFVVEEPMWITRPCESLDENSFRKWSDIWNKWRQGYWGFPLCFWSFLTSLLETLWQLPIYIKALIFVCFIEITRVLAII